jgi:hypothetical protein
MRTYLAVLFPYLVIEFVFEHPWPFIVLAGIWLVAALAQKK